jgi:hypothetical protein
MEAISTILTITGIFLMVILIATSPFTVPVACWYILARTRMPYAKTISIILSVFIVAGLLLFFD